jgi:group I intron endonuclease
MNRLQKILQIFHLKINDAASKKRLTIMVSIYKITSPTGKVYIGQTWLTAQRISQYKGVHCKGQPKLYNSIKKHGFGNHAFDIIHQLPQDVDQETIDRYEDLYMTAYRDCGVELLNLRHAGSRGKHTAETIAKMKNKHGKWMLGRKMSEGHKEMLRQKNTGNKYNLGRTPSEETKKKLSQIHKGRIGPFKGGHHSEEHKQSLSEKMKGNKFSVGVKWTPEQREKMMASRKEPWNKGRKGLYIKSDAFKQMQSKRMSGENHHHVKLTDLQVIELRGRFNNGEKCMDLCKEFRISHSHCVKLATNKTRQTCVPS